MAKPAIDVSPNHFRWLVESRSRNQIATAELYRIMSENEQRMNRDVDLQLAAQELTGIAFSLWRAVFLSDTTGDSADRLADVKTFLISLIADNTVLYVTDKNARNWSFRYYLDDARFRLLRLAESHLDLIEMATRIEAETEKEEWLMAQSTFEIALANFDQAAREQNPAAAS